MDNKRILAFGGNGFLGAEVITRLLKDGAKIVLISRGNWYWDSDVRIRPNVIHIQWDRNLPLENCADFNHILETIPYFDAVVDFSLYSVEGLKAVLPLLKGKIGVYIYISSDSVYEVCIKSHSNPTVEEDSVRPETKEERLRLNSLDSYGHNKLDCEEYFQNHLSDISVSYVFIRVPDIIGPRDTTRRWWIYQMWVQFYKEVEQPIIIDPSIKDSLLSLSFTRDIAEVIVHILKTPEQFYNQAYNIAFKENFTLSQLLKDMAEELSIDSIDFIVKEFNNTYPLFPDTVKDNFPINYSKLYPTVSQGPVNIAKAENILKFQPTPWKQALKNCVEFYLDALVKFPKERDSVMNLLLKDIVPLENHEKFKNAIMKAAKIA